MRVDVLTKHIIDTVKEWQIKIGYMPGNMKLYYPAESLVSLLDIPEGCGEKSLKEYLEKFSIEQEKIFGKIQISCDTSGERFCLDISAQGTAYIAFQIPAPEFLTDFLKTITTPGNSIEDVKECFRKFALGKNIEYVELDQRDKGLGHTFYFKQYEEDPYIYCVESDAFGLTYHRFDQNDYRQFLIEGHHHEAE